MSSLSLSLSLYVSLSVSLSLSISISLTYTQMNTRSNAHTLSLSHLLSLSLLSCLSLSFSITYPGYLSSSLFQSVSFNQPADNVHSKDKTWQKGSSTKFKTIGKIFFFFPVLKVIFKYFPQKWTRRRNSNILFSFPIFVISADTPLCIWKWKWHANLLFKLSLALSPFLALSQAYSEDPKRKG